MPAFDASLLAEWTAGRWSVPPSAPIHGFTNDSRRLEAGQVFVALKTGRRDGHDFLAAAAAAGASGAIVSRADATAGLPQLVVRDPLLALQAIARAHRRWFSGEVVGVSGSVGKTSTKDLLAQLLGGGSAVLATEGNLNNFIGVPLTLTRLDPAGHARAVIEAGISEPGEMAPLADMIQPDHAVITLVAPAHLEKMGSLEAIAEEKSLLAAGRRAGGYAVFPASCLAYAAFRALPGPWLVVVDQHSLLPAVAQGTIVTFSAESRDDQTKLALAFNGANGHHFTLRRVSTGMAQNVVLAIALAHQLGVSDESIQRALAHWRPAQWRGEIRRDGPRTLYLDFYNANPASMADALDSFGAMTPAEPRLYVLGCMEELGPQSEDYHRALGHTLRLRPEDRLFLIGDQAEAVRQGVLDHDGSAGGRVTIVTGLAPVADAIAAFAGAVFLKGSRRYQLESALESIVAVAGH